MSAPQHSEYTELMTLVAAGDTAAQGIVLQRLGRRVRTVAQAILGNSADAEDATQSILLEILTCAKTYRGGNLLAWADRIAVRMAIRHARQRRIRDARYDAQFDPESVAADLGFHPERDVARPIVEYLAQLPETRRVALVLRHVMDYSIDEIAELTEVSPNTVKDRLLHGREHLRKLIRRETALARVRDKELR